jgi:hypothetical protein
VFRFPFFQGSSFAISRKVRASSTSPCGALAPRVDSCECDTWRTNTQGKTEAVNRRPVGPRGNTYPSCRFRRIMPDRTVDSWPAMIPTLTISAADRRLHRRSGDLPGLWPRNCRKSLPSAAEGSGGRRRDISGRTDGRTAGKSPFDEGAGDPNALDVRSENSESELIENRRRWRHPIDGVTFASVGAARERTWNVVVGSHAQQWRRTHTIRKYRVNTAYISTHCRLTWNATTPAATCWTVADAARNRHSNSRRRRDTVMHSDARYTSTVSSLADTTFWHKERLLQYPGRRQPADAAVVRLIVCWT